MVELVYASAARPHMELREIAAMLERARVKNQRLGVTGILLYDKGFFLQVLEGEPKTVHALYATIANDPRHHHLRVLHETPLSTRHFAAWTMGFVTLDAALTKQFQHRHSFRGNGSLLDDQAAVLEFLEGFRSGRWHDHIVS